MAGELLTQVKARCAVALDDALAVAERIEELGALSRMLNDQLVALVDPELDERDPAWDSAFAEIMEVSGYSRFRDAVDDLAGVLANVDSVSSDDTPVTAADLRVRYGRTPEVERSRSAFQSSIEQRLADLDRRIDAVTTGGSA